MAGDRGSDDPCRMTGEPPSQPALRYVSRRPCRWRLRRGRFRAPLRASCARRVGETLEKPWRADSVRPQWVEGWDIRLCAARWSSSADGRGWTPACRDGRAGCCFAYLVAQPRPRLPARRADRPAVARGAARRGRHRAQRAALQAAPRARRRRAGRPLRAAAARSAPVERRRRGARARRSRGPRPRWRPATRRRRADRAREALGDRPADLPARLRRAVGGRAAARARDAAPARRSRRSPRRACARAGASSARPSRRRAPRSPPRRSASPRTGC